MGNEKEIFMAKVQKTLYRYDAIGFCKFYK